MCPFPGPPLHLARRRADVGDIYRGAGRGRVCACWPARLTRAVAGQAGDSDVNVFSFAILDHGSVIVAVPDSDAASSAECGVFCRRWVFFWLIPGGCLAAQHLGGRRPDVDEAALQDVAAVDAVADPH